MRIKGSVKQLLDLWEVQVEHPEHSARIAKHVSAAIADVRERVLLMTEQALQDFVGDTADYISVYFTDSDELVVKWDSGSEEENDVL